MGAQPSERLESPGDIDPRWELRFVRASVVAGGSVVAVGVAAFLGWVFDVPALKSLYPNLATMKANTAILFVLLGLAVSLAHSGRRRARRAVLVLGLLVAAGALATLTEYALGRNLGIDEILVRDLSSLESPGRMAPATAVDFVLFGVALVLRGGSNRRTWASQIVVVVAATIALVAFCGYIYSARVETIVEKRGVSIALGAIVEGSGRRCASRRSARARAGADGEVLGGVGEFSASRDLLIAAA